MLLKLLQSFPQFIGPVLRGIFTGKERITVLLEKAGKNGFQRLHAFQGGFIVIVRIYVKPVSASGSLNTAFRGYRIDLSHQSRILFQKAAGQ